MFRRLFRLARYARRVYDGLSPMEQRLVQMVIGAVVSSLAGVLDTLVLPQSA